MPVANRVEPARLDLSRRMAQALLDWRSILLPPSIVEYIILHEFVHLHESHYTPAFWTRVERAMPDFAKRKQWLAENAPNETECSSA